jgi:hypothetical protein
MTHSVTFRWSSRGGMLRTVTYSRAKMVANRCVRDMVFFCLSASTFSNGFRRIGLVLPGRPIDIPHSPAVEQITRSSVNWGRFISLFVNWDTLSIIELIWCFQKVCVSLKINFHAFEGYFKFSLLAFHKLVAPVGLPTVTMTLLRVTVLWTLIIHDYWHVNLHH